MFPLSPKGIIDHLKLRQPGYLQTAAYGHFGQQEFAWEHTDAADELLAKAKKYDGHSARKIRELKVASAS